MLVPGTPDFPLLEGRFNFFVATVLFVEPLVPVLLDEDAVSETLALSEQCVDAGCFLILTVSALLGFFLNNSNCFHASSSSRLGVGGVDSEDGNANDVVELLELGDDKAVLLLLLLLLLTLLDRVRPCCCCCLLDALVKRAYVASVLMV